MKIKGMYTVALLGLGFVTAGSALAQHPGIEQKDSTFATQAAGGGIAEVKLGELAQQKGTTSAVTEFGKRMVTDHSNANDQLKGVASRDNITLPTTMDSKDQAEYNKLSKLSGTEFDKAYAKDMVQDHEKDIAAFKKEANDGQNPDVKNFAQQTLPTLQSHLQAAQEMERSVNSGMAGH